MATKRKRIDSLPAEIVRRICNFLVKSDILALCHVSKNFNAAARQRLYRSIVFMDPHDELHLLDYKKFINRNSFYSTVLSNEQSLEMLIASLKAINPDNQRFVKEFRCFLEYDSSKYTLDVKIRELLQLDIAPTALVCPIFTQEYLCFNASRLLWLSVGENIKPSYDFSETETPRAPLQVRFVVPKLQMLHLRSCSEKFGYSLLRDADGLLNVTALRLTGTSIDDDYEHFPNQVQETASIYELDRYLQQLAPHGSSTKFASLRHLTLHKYQFAPFMNRAFVPELQFVDLGSLHSLALLNCKVPSDSPYREPVQKYFADTDYGQLEQFVFEHSSVVDAATMRKMVKLRRFHMTRGSFSFREVLRLLGSLESLERFSLNDSKLMRDFCRIFKSHRDSNLLFSRRFLNTYQFQPTQPTFKYTEDHITRLFSMYSFITDYVGTMASDDVNPFNEIYFDDKSFINRYLKTAFEPFKEEIDSKIKPIAENIFKAASPTLKYVKICGMGFKRTPQGSCYLDV